MKKLFLALWPDADIRSKIQDLNLRLEALGVKSVKSENFHVTLVFIGAVENQLANHIASTCTEVRADPFTLVFDGLDFWRKPRVLCLTSSAQVPVAMMDLVNHLAKRIEALGVVTDKRPYRPHITLARKAQRALTAQFNPMTWHADAFSLVESFTENSGPYYKVLQTWQF